MKALSLLRHGELVLQDVPEPRPGPDEVAVRVLAVGICRTDLEVISGEHGAYREGIGRLPIVLGHEWAAEILEVGSRVAAFRPGELVTGETGIGCLRCRWCRTGRHNLCRNVVETGIFNRDGAMRQVHVHPALFTHSAEGLQPEEAALVEPASVAVHALRRGRIAAGEVVAVLGCGPIGLLAVQVARALGAANVMATSRSQPKLDLARRLGADLAVNARSDDVAARAADMTAGNGFDLVVDCTGNPAALATALDIVAPGGRVVVVGAHGSRPFGHQLDALVGKELELIGIRGSPHAWQAAISLMRRGTIQASPLITHRFPLTRYAEAFELARRGGPDVVKVLLLPQQ